MEKELYAMFFLREFDQYKDRGRLGKQAYDDDDNLVSVRLTIFAILSKIMIIFHFKLSRKANERNSESKKFHLKKSLLR
jgi:hypothetical protein